MRRLLPLLVGLLLVAHLVPRSSFAQYFGRNKVVYETFDYRILRTDRFDFHYTSDKYPPEARSIHDAGRMAERWSARHDSILGHRLSGRRSVILYADQSDFHQTNVVQGLGEGTGGVTEGLRSRLVMPLTGRYADTDHVLGHEMVHVYQYDLAQDTASVRGGLQAMGQLPLWFVEGMAEYLSLGSEYPQTGVWLRDALVHDRLPTLRDLTQSARRYFPYRWGHAFWAYMAGTRGDSVVAELYSDALRTGLPLALENRLDVQSQEALSREWQEAIRATYGPVVEGRTRPQDAGRRILAPEQGAGSMNLSPAVSPDGRYVAYLSEQGLFSIDLYIADAETGETIARLSSSTTSRHFNALRFIESSGAWSPDGARFAYPVVREGRNEIAIFDVDDRSVARRIRVEEVEEINHVAWAPRGGFLVVSGLAEGQSDLFRIELPPENVRGRTFTARTKRLTDDRYADLQPEFSPDGSTVVFTTDRAPGTSFERLTYASMRLGFLELESGEIETRAPFEDGDHVNPQYAPNGDLYFVSDRDGVPDVYRMAPSEDTPLFRVTDLATGVTGITPLSPALTVARGTGRVLISVFEDTEYIVYGRPAEDARGTPVTDRPERRLAHRLPTDAPDSLETADEGLAPVGRSVNPAGEQLIDRLIANADYGLPGFTTFEERDYRPRLSLDYVSGSGGVGIGTGGFYGTQVGASGALFMSFSDEMGDHNLASVIYANGGVRDLGAYGYYLNQRRRWNWGGALGHIPYRQSYSIYGATLEGGPYVGILDERIYYDQAAAFTTYPFDPYRRVEFELGYLRMGSSRELTRYFYRTGRRDRIDYDAPEPVHLGQFATALVGDRSVFGFASPIQGHRYHLEVQPSVGTYNTVGVIADVRKYLFARPLTLAGRALHWAEYDLTERPVEYENNLFIGYGTLMRGYGWWSFDADECPTSGEVCPVLDRLIGSRALIGNLEMRLPLLGNDRFGLLNFPYLPTELSVFLDGGLAWTQDESPSFELAATSRERIPVFSTGVSFRINLFGYLVLEPYYAYPFQRPEKGWHWGLVLSPGW